MDKDRRKYTVEEDDGRTIASMENLDRRGLIGSWFGALDPTVRAEHGFGRSGRKETPEKVNAGGFDRLNMESDELDPEDRRALVKYVLGYSLAIGAVFAAAFGIVIFLMWKFW